MIGIEQVLVKLLVHVASHVSVPFTTSLIPRTTKAHSCLTRTHAQGQICMHWKAKRRIKFACLIWLTHTSTNRQIYRKFMPKPVEIRVFSCIHSSMLKLVCDILPHGWSQPHVVFYQKMVQVASRRRSTH